MWRIILSNFSVCISWKLLLQMQFVFLFLFLLIFLFLLLYYCWADVRAAVVMWTFLLNALLVFRYILLLYFVLFVVYRLLLLKAIKHLAAVITMCTENIKRYHLYDLKSKHTNVLLINVINERAESFLLLLLSSTSDLLFWFIVF